MNATIISLSISTAPGTLFEGKLVRLAQQFDGLINIGRLAEVKAHPTTIEQDMVGFGSTSSHDLIPDLGGEGDIHQVVAVNMSNLAPAETVFCTAESMGMGRYTFPIGQRGRYSFERLLETYQNFHYKGYFTGY